MTAFFALTPGEEFYLSCVVLFFVFIKWNLGDVVFQTELSQIVVFNQAIRRFKQLHLHAQTCICKIFQFCQQNRARRIKANKAIYITLYQVQFSPVKKDIPDIEYFLLQSVQPWYDNNMVAIPSKFDSNKKDILDIEYFLLQPVQSWYNNKMVAIPSKFKLLETKNLLVNYRLDYDFLHRAFIVQQNYGCCRKKN